MRALVLFAVLAGSTAHATWHSTSIAGTPRDINTPDAGVSVVAKTGGVGASAAVFPATAGGGIVVGGQSLAGPNYMSAVLRGPCLLGFTAPPNASMSFDANCANDLYTYNNASGRLRASSSGAVYSYSWSGTQTMKVERLDPAASTALGNWAALATNNSLANVASPLSVVVTDAGEWAATEIEVVGAPIVRLFRNNATAGDIDVQNRIRDIALFEANGRPGAVVLTDGGRLLISEDMSVPDGGFFTVPLLAPFTSVTFDTAHGSVNGRGFGMATTDSQLFSAVPNPNAIGKVWVPRTGGGAPANLVRISCVDSKYCGGIAGVGGQNVWAYFNASAPTSENRPAIVPAGGTSTYVLDAGDPDGDPIWVRWTGGSFFWDGGDPRTITVIGPSAPYCGAMVAPLTGFVSDGLALNDLPITVPVTVTGALPPPLILDPVSVDLTAGGMPESVFARYPADSGCVLPPLTWTIGDAGFGLNLADSGVRIVPPQFFCSATPGTFNLTASASPDASVSIPVTLQPWGAPYAPTFNPSMVMQTAGTDASYLPELAPIHFCQTAPLFPGADLVWITDAGSPGVTVVTDGTSLTVYSTDACVGGRVSAIAKRRVNMTMPAQLSVGSGSLQVELVPYLSPLATASFDAGFAYDSAMSLLAGNFSTDATCATGRDLRATVVVSVRDGGALASDAGLGVPGAWSIQVPGGCEGGRFEAVAYLTNAAGVPQGPTASFSFDPPALPPRVPALTATTVPVTCGGGAAAQLTLEVLPTDCAAQQYTWSQLEGPGLTIVPDGGAVVSFATATQDLQAQAGQNLSWSVTASTGSMSATETRTVRLVPAAFVEISHRTDALAREEESVGVEVILNNTTSCVVSDVLLEERGLKPILGSVRLAGGGALEATLAGDVLEIPALTLPPGVTRITYLAKAPLLSVPRPRGVVRLAGTDVTRTPAPVGCGCDSAASGVFALLALAGVLVRSRRRSG